MGDRDANTLFVPFTTLKTAFNIGDRVGFFAMTAKPGTDGPELERQVREALSRHHRVSPTDDLAIGSFNMFVMFGKFQTFFFVLRLMSLDRRRRDAARRRRRRVEHHADHGQGAHEGDRRAQGARRDAVLDRLDGDEGVDRADADRRPHRRRRRRRPDGAADAVLANAPDSPLGPPNVGLSTVLRAVGVLVVAGALAGIMPASHAASIKPIEALRAE